MFFALRVNNRPLSLSLCWVSNLRLHTWKASTLTLSHIFPNLKVEGKDGSGTEQLGKADVCWPEAEYGGIVWWVGFSGNDVTDRQTENVLINRGRSCQSCICGPVSICSLSFGALLGVEMWARELCRVPALKSILPWLRYLYRTQVHLFIGKLFFFLYLWTYYHILQNGGHDNNNNIKFGY